MCKTDLLQHALDELDGLGSGLALLVLGHELVHAAVRLFCLQHLHLDYVLALALLQQGKNDLFSSRKKKDSSILQ